MKYGGKTNYLNFLKIDFKYIAITIMDNSTVIILPMTAQILKLIGITSLV